MPENAVKPLFATIGLSVIFAMGCASMPKAYDFQGPKNLAIESRFEGKVLYSSDLQVYIYQETKPCLYEFMGFIEINGDGLHEVALPIARHLAIANVTETKHRILAQAQFGGENWVYFTPQSGSYYLLKHSETETSQETQILVKNPKQPSYQKVIEDKKKACQRE